LLVNRVFLQVNNKNQEMAAARVETAPDVRAAAAFRRVLETSKVAYCRNALMESGSSRDQRHSSSTKMLNQVFFGTTKNQFQEIAEYSS
jgi:hypothetical protein